MPDDSANLCYLSLCDVRKRFADGSLTPSDLLTVCIDRIAATEPHVNALVHTMFTSARERAIASSRRWADGLPLSDLDGIPICVKDIFDTQGVLTEGGCQGLRGRIPEDDAAVVKALKDAGAIIVGKSATTELASGGILNPQYREEVTCNPYDVSKHPGASSCGSVASVAAGQVMAALGSDTGGSIRGPASFCGLTGFKPTYGAVSKRGVLPLSRTLDHVGPLCRSASDCALLLKTIWGYDALDFDSIVSAEFTDHVVRAASDVKGTKVAVVPSLLIGTSAEVRKLFDEALDVFRCIGCEILEVEPLAGTADEDLDVWQLISAIMLPEKAMYYEDLLKKGSDQVSEICSETTFPYLGSSCTAYLHALAQRERVEAAFEACLQAQSITAFLLPTTKVTAPPLPKDMDEQRAQRRKVRKIEANTSALPELKNDAYNCTIFNLTRQPSVAFPIGMDSEGMPASCMLTGKKWQDGQVLQLAHCFQKSTKHHLCRPNLQPNVGGLAQSL